MSAADNPGKDPDNPVAALLERAAKGIREVARAATPGRWLTFADGGCWYVTSSTHGQVTTGVHESGDPLVMVERDERDARHIASWSPDKAEAVAALLEKTAESARLELTWRGLGWHGMPCGCEQHWECAACLDPWTGTPEGCQCWDAAVKVAQAWLGEAPGGQ